MFSSSSENDLWEKLISMAQSRTSMEIRVSATNPGGLLCEPFPEVPQGPKGFIPNSHVLDLPESKSKLIGETLEVTPIEVNPASKRLILSEKEAHKVKHLASLKVKSLVNGQISHVQPYGFFIDLGHGVSGLLHKSSLPSNSADSDCLEVGKTIDVQIERKEGDRIALTLDNQPTANPEQALADSCLIFEGQLFFNRKFLSAEELSDSEFAVLRCLSQRCGETVPYNFLQELTSNDNIAAIQAIVHQLRHHSLLRERIKTEHGVGYRLEVPKG